VRAQLVDVDLGRGEADAEIAACSASSITAATCSSAFDGMQPTLRQTPPQRDGVALDASTVFMPRSAERTAAAPGAAE
jgi:hypothetical protein